MAEYNEYNYSNLEHKHYFAGILNTAHHNFTLALQETAERCKLGKKATINEIFKFNLLQKDWNYRIENMADSLPFIKYLKYDNRNEFTSQLLLFYNTIYNLRNEYTHYYHKPTEINPQVFEILNFILFETAKTVKKKRLKNNENKAFLPKQYEVEFAGLSEKESNSLFNKAFGNILFKKKVLDTKINEQKIAKGAPSRPTYYNEFIYAKNMPYPIEDESINLKEYALCSKDNLITQNGFILLVSLCLNKKQAEELYAHTKGFKNTSTLKYLATRWVFSHNCYKDIKKALKSEYSNDSLLLQMIEELNKCPKELFDVLADKNKLEFIEDLNEYVKDNVKKDEGIEKSTVIHPVIRKRYEDKFAYFAVRFLDEFANFKSLRFQINFGNYIHDRRTKDIKGINLSTERTVKESFKILGKLSEIDEIKKTYFREKESNELGWQEYPDVSYILDNNNIPISFIKGFEKSEIQEKEPRKSGKNKTDYLSEIFKDKEFNNSAPIAFLSVNELPALLYEFLFNNKSGEQIENIIKKKIFEQINAVRNPKLADKKNVPKLLLKANLDTETIDFNKLINQIKEDLNTIENKKIEYSKFLKPPRNAKKDFIIKFSNKQKGEIATWVANDIKRIIGTKLRKNFKGYQLSELQAMIAAYGLQKNNLKLFLHKELGIDIEHNEILKESLKGNYLEDFYKKYLDTRLNFFNNFLICIETNKANYNDSKIKKEIDKVFEYFTKRLYIIPNKETYTKNLLLQPVNLPRGIFDGKPVAFNLENKNEQKAAWFEKAIKTDLQEFYSFNREYPFGDKIPKDKLKINTNKGIKEQTLFRKDIQNDIYKNEKRIREIQRQDFYVLEMAKHILKQINKDVAVPDNYSLKDLFLTKKEKAEIRANAEKQNQRQIGDISENIVNDDHILSKRFKVSILDNKLEDTVALKEIGKFKQLAKDERVRKLVNYSEKIWSKLEIEDEIHNYETIRKEEIFKLVHALEKEIFELAKLDDSSSEHPKKLEHNGNPNFRHYLAFKYLYGIENDFVNSELNIEDLQKRILNNSDEISFKVFILLIIRNKFAHNQLPDKEVFDAIKNLIPIESLKMGTYLKKVFEILK